MFRRIVGAWGEPATRMFKKPGKDTPDPLGDRMRKISGAAPPEEKTYTSIHQDNKRSPRQATFKQATITTRGGERIAVVVKNVSDTGARIEYMREVSLGDHVLLSEPTLRIKTWAEVVWETRGAAGLRFVKT
jgi:hypothetical protein